ncbi:LysE family translocator [Segnochrobactraceae bacterium EtOH-i3]
MELSALLVFAAALGLAAATPGPGMTAIVARALGAGFLGTLPMILGLVLGDLLYLSAAAFGLAALASSFGTLFLIVRWAGAAYLVYLAVKMWRAPLPMGLSGDARPTRGGSVGRTFFAGLFITLGNPKTMVFYLALLPTLIDLGSMTLVGFAEIATLVVAILIVVGSAYALAADRARTLLRSRRAIQTLNRSAGALMAGAAAAIVTR